MKDIDDIYRCDPCPSTRKGEFSSVEVIVTPINDYCLWSKHVNWWWTNRTPITRKWSYAIHKIQRCKGGAVVNINEWKTSYNYVINEW